MASTFPFFFAPPTHTQSSVRAQATYEGLLPEGLERHSMSAASANINRCTLPPPRKPTSPDEFGELHALVITLMQMPQLPSRPAFVEDPLFAHGMFYREDRAAAGTRRRYTAPSMTIELDSWSHSGGATKTRFAIPEHLQAGDEPQVLVRRAGTVLRTGRATLRFHHYTVEPRVGAGNPVLYHVLIPNNIQQPQAVQEAQSSPWATSIPQIAAPDATPWLREGCGIDSLWGQSAAVCEPPQSRRRAEGPGAGQSGQHNAAARGSEHEATCVVDFGIFSALLEDEYVGAGGRTE